MLPIEPNVQHMAMSLTAESSPIYSGQKVIQMAISVLGLITGLIMCGCNSTLSTQAEPIKPVMGEDVDLRTYQNMVIVPFQLDTTDQNSKKLADAFRNDLILRLKYDFGYLFEFIGDSDIKTNAHTLRLTGIVNRFEEGNEEARFWLSPLPVPGASAILSVDISVSDANSGDVLMRYEVRKRADIGAPIVHRQWQDLVAEASGGVAKSIALAKGWRK
jgi:hypothetical protein